MREGCDGRAGAPVRGVHRFAAPRPRRSRGSPRRRREDVRRHLGSDGELARGARRGAPDCGSAVRAIRARTRPSAYASGAGVGGAAGGVGWSGAACRHRSRPPAGDRGSSTRGRSRRRNVVCAHCSFRIASCRAGTEAEPAEARQVSVDPGVVALALGVPTKRAVSARVRWRSRGSACAGSRTGIRSSLAPLPAPARRGRSLTRPAVGLGVPIGLDAPPGHIVRTGGRGNGGDLGGFPEGGKLVDRDADDGPAPDGRGVALAIFGQRVDDQDLIGMTFAEGAPVFSGDVVAEGLLSLCAVSLTPVLNSSPRSSMTQTAPRSLPPARR